LERSDIEPDLFRGIGGCVSGETADETDAPHCLDERCFKEKYEAWVEKARAQAEKKVKEPIVTIAAGYNRHAPKADRQAWNVQPAKKGDRDAVPVMRVDGPTAGKVEWAILPKSEKPTQAEEEPVSIEVQRRGHMVDELRAWLDSQEKCPPALCDAGRMLVAVAVYGCNLYNVIAKTPDEFDKAASGERPEFWDEFWNAIKPGLAGECYVRAGATTEGVADLDLVMHVCGLDKQDFLDSAVKAFPEPEPLCVCGHDKAAHAVPGAPGETGLCRTCGGGKHGCDAYRPAAAKKTAAGKGKGVKK
jgi:hypothetical protein